jgi:hypothetical protein
MINKIESVKYNVFFVGDINIIRLELKILGVQSADSKSG